MEDRYHATTQDWFYPDMSNVNKNITVEAKIISPPTTLKFRRWCMATVSICAWRARTEPHGKSDRCTVISRLSQTVASHANWHLSAVTQYFNNTDIKNLSHEGNFQSKKKEKEEHLFFLHLLHVPCNRPPPTNPRITKVFLSGSRCYKRNIYMSHIVFPRQ